MFNVQEVDTLLQVREQVNIAGVGHVRNIATDEELARIKAQNVIGGHPAVGAANPKMFR